MNSDGNLNLEEFKALNTHFTKVMTEKFGDWPAYTNEEVEMVYKVYDTISDHDGVCKDDFHQIHDILEMCE